MTATDFKGVHAGKRLFILASGPSLSGLDLAPLRRRLVMGLNRSILLHPDTQYHCAMDHRLFVEYAEAFAGVRYMFTIEGRPFGVGLRLLGAEGFSWDLAEGIYSGYTVSYFALQVAVYMGFQEVCFLGLDLRHEEGRTHFFGSDYCSRNHEDTEFPRMRRMFEQAAPVLAEKGIAVYNCSPTSTLECFPHLSYSEALAL